MSVEHTKTSSMNAYLFLGSDPFPVSHLGDWSEDGNDVTVHPPSVATRLGDCVSIFSQVSDDLVRLAAALIEAAESLRSIRVRQGSAGLSERSSSGLEADAGHPKVDAGSG